MVLAEHFEEWINAPPTCQPMMGVVVEGQEDLIYQSPYLSFPIAYDEG